MEGGIDIVVVGYHAEYDLFGFVEALRASEISIPYTLSVELVEGTPQEEVAALQLVDGLPATVTVHWDNCGYARACNSAATKLNSPVIAFFNADTRLRPGVVERCVETLFSDPSYAVVGPRQVDDLGRIVHGGIFGRLEAPEHRGWQKPDAGFDDVRDDAVTVSGSAYFVKRSVWDELTHCPLYRAFDPDSEGAMLTTFLYYEETWFSYHAIGHGYKNVYDGVPKMIHRYHQSIGPAGLDGGPLFRESKQRFVAACQSHGIPHN